MFPHTPRVYVLILFETEFVGITAGLQCEADDDISVKVWSWSNMMYLIKASSTVKRSALIHPSKTSALHLCEEQILLCFDSPHHHPPSLLSLLRFVSKRRRYLPLLFYLRLLDWWASSKQIILTIWIMAETNHMEASGQKIVLIKHRCLTMCQRGVICVKKNLINCGFVPPPHTHTFYFGNAWFKSGKRNMLRFMRGEKRRKSILSVTIALRST